MPIGGDRYYTHKIERIYEKKCFNQLTGRVLTKQYITSKKEDWFTAMGIISDFVQITNDNWSMLIGRRYYQIILFIYTLIFLLLIKGELYYIGSGFSWRHFHRLLYLQCTLKGNTIVSLADGIFVEPNFFYPSHYRYLEFEMFWIKAWRGLFSEGNATKLFGV